jgi:hypothetical protein
MWRHSVTSAAKVVRMVGAENVYLQGSSAPPVRSCTSCGIAGDEMQLATRLCRAVAGSPPQLPQLPQGWRSISDFRCGRLERESRLESRHLIARGESVLATARKSTRRRVAEWGVTWGYPPRRVSARKDPRAVTARGSLWRDAPTRYNRCNWGGLPGCETGRPFVHQDL